MSHQAERLSAALADRYRIERELGQGGMATVCLAHDVHHDRKVALKVTRGARAVVPLARLGHLRRDLAWRQRGTGGPAPSPLP